MTCCAIRTDPMPGNWYVAQPNNTFSRIRTYGFTVASIGGAGGVTLYKDEATPDKRFIPSSITKPGYRDLRIYYYPPTNFYS